ncbi:hypothetical protein J1N35_028242 [Gossypium stocksii]|uniref:Uncharacterized protein n=1 Tax=Gossypium stocksii TaxID=47602 RepID=A0A9D3UVP9_9ROSI|nr:hypothetical protein J1N35_028242 [Gossypium stocksii]
MEYLTIGNCVQVFQLEGRFLVSSLEKLHLKNMQELQVIWKAPEQIATFQNLTISNASLCLPIPEEFKVEESFELEHVFRHEDETNTVTEEDMVHPKLKRLELLQLPSLVYFSPLGYHFMFPRLNVTTVMENCPSMTMCFTVDVNNLTQART